MYLPGFRERPITKEIDGWKPPDTRELEELGNLLNKVGKRIHALRIAFLMNDEEENAKIRQVMRRRKTAIEKAYQRGRRDGCKRRKRNSLFPTEGKR